MLQRTQMPSPYPFFCQLKKASASTSLANACKIFQLEGGLPSKEITDDIVGCEFLWLQVQLQRVGLSAFISLLNVCLDGLCDGSHVNFYALELDKHPKFRRHIHFAPSAKTGLFLFQRRLLCRFGFWAALPPFYRLCGVDLSFALPSTPGLLYRLGRRVFGLSSAPFSSRGFILAHNLRYSSSFKQKQVLQPA